MHEVHLHDETDSNNNNIVMYYILMFKSMMDYIYASGLIKLYPLEMSQPSQFV